MRRSAQGPNRRVRLWDEGFSLRENTLRPIATHRNAVREWVTPLHWAPAVYASDGGEARGIKTPRFWVL